MTTAQQHISPLHRRPRRRGEMSPLVSLAIAGGIGALILYGVVSYGNDTSSKASANAEYEKLVAIKNKVIKTFGSRFTNLATPSAAEFAQSGLAPASMIIGNTVINGRNGAVSISNWTGNAFYIETVGAALDDCMAIGIGFSDDPTVIELHNMEANVVFQRATNDLPLNGDRLSTLCGTSTARTLRIGVAP